MNNKKLAKKLVDVAESLTKAAKNKRGTYAILEDLKRLNQQKYTASGGEAQQLYEILDEYKAVFKELSEQEYTTKEGAEQLLEIINDIKMACGCKPDPFYSKAYPEGRHTHLRTSK